MPERSEGIGTYLMVVLDLVTKGAQFSGSRFFGDPKTGDRKPVPGGPGTKNRSPV
jgi:hypothetical protein